MRHLQNKTILPLILAFLLFFSAVSYAQNAVFYSRSTSYLYYRQALVFNDVETVKTFTIYGNAATSVIVVEMADFTNPVTATITITNPNNNALYTIGALPEAATSVLIVERPIVGLNTFTLTLNGAAGAPGGTCYIGVYLK